MLEATPEERIELLLQQRARLVMAKKPLEEKLARLNARKRDEELQNASPEDRRRMEAEERETALPKEEPKPKAREFRWFGH